MFDCICYSAIDHVKVSADYLQTTLMHAENEFIRRRGVKVILNSGQDGKTYRCYTRNMDFSELRQLLQNRPF